MSKSNFKPAEGVTIENAMEHIAAVEDAVREGIFDLPVGDRSVVIGMIAMTLKLSLTSLLAFKEKLEKEGLATPPSGDQLLEVQMLMRRAAETDKKES